MILTYEQGISPAAERHKEHATLYAGVELGGTKCICTLAKGSPEVVEQTQFATTSPEETLSAISAQLDRWQRDHRLAALGVASFGPIDLSVTSAGHGRIGATTKLLWRGADVGAVVRHRGLPLALDTDVGGAALAEGAWGAAAGLASYVYVTIGTGVGAGIVVNGRLVQGWGHPEAGHLHVARRPGDEWSGACVYHGDCVEGLASGLAIAARVGRPAQEITSDDPVWSSVAHAIAGLCHNLVMTSAPQRIVLGGGVMNGQPRLMPLVRQMLVDQLGGYGIAGEIAAAIDDFVCPPSLGDQAGPLGPIALALQAVQELAPESDVRRIRATG